MTDPKNAALNKVHEPVSEMEKILGRPPETPAEEVPPAEVPTLDPTTIRPEWKGYYEKLINLRDTFLEQEQAGQNMALENQPEYITQIADAATESFLRDEELGLVSHDVEMLTEIQEALQRMADGTYGVCQMTGKPIPPERLDAVPWTRFTVEAEAELEKNQQDPVHAKLHPRGSLSSSQGNAATQETGNE